MNQNDLKPAKEFAQRFGIKCVVFGPPGSGKCLAPGTPVLMFDGTVKLVEAIRVNDLLMGPDSLPRRVTGLAHGFEDMFDVIPTKGDTYRVNRSHILSLNVSNRNYIANITIDQYFAQSNDFKHHAKGWRVGVNFPTKEVSIHPYLLGLWLGDGSSDELAFHTVDPEIVEFLDYAANLYGLRVHRYQKAKKCPRYRLTNESRGLQNVLRQTFKNQNLFNNKHIPFAYKTNSREIRLQVLAGLIDSDGHLANNGYSITSKFPVLADDICYLARSLGLAAYKVQTINKSQNGTEGIYYRVSISGHTDMVPTLLKRKQATPRKQKKDVLNTGIKVQYAGFGEYFGFELEGHNKLFLLGDFTVTHNTPLVNTAPRPVLLATEPGLLSMRGSNVPTWLAPTTDKIDEFMKWFEHSNEAKNFDTLAIDSSSQMCDIALDMAKKKSSHGLQQYGIMAEYVMPYMKRLYFMPQKHMYLIAKEEVSPQGLRRPYYPGKQLPTDIPHLYDCILRIAKAQVPNVGEQLAFQCNGTFDVLARNRTGNLADFEPPDFSALVKKAMES